MKHPGRQPMHQKLLDVTSNKCVILFKLAKFCGRVDLVSDVDRVELFRLTLRFFDDVSTAS